MSKKISIVIRCLNENKNLKVLIPLLLKQSCKDFELIFVDSGSTDGSLDTVKSYLNSSNNVQLTYIKKEEFTFGRSLNIGFNKSRGEIVISLSAHCFPTSEEWLKNITQPFSDDSIGIVYGKQSPHENTRFSEASVQEKWFSGKSMKKEDKGDMDNDGKDEPDDEEYMDNKDKAIKKAMGKTEESLNNRPKKKLSDIGGVVGIPSLGDMIKRK